MSHLVLIDASSLIYRAHFATQGPNSTRLTRSDGLPVGALHTFCTMLWKQVLRNGIDGQMPSHVGVVFDHPSKSFRSAIYPAYKATRPARPDDLAKQMPFTREVCRAFGIPIEQEGFEADDLIATYTRIAHERGFEVTIIGADKDLMQLVGGGVTMIDAKDRRIGVDEVVEKFGVAPYQMPDLQALLGDTIDNVPGVPGIGEKTAAALIQQYGDLEGVLSHAHEIPQPRRRAELLRCADQARIALQLVTLDSNVPIKVPLDCLGAPYRAEIDSEATTAALLAFCASMEFRSLAARITEARA